MLKQLTKQDVEKIIAGLVASDIAYTAYDITKILRNADFMAPHAEVHKYVHGYSYPLHYETTPIEFTHKSVKCASILFHKIGYDTDLYDPEAFASPDPNAGSVANTVISILSGYSKKATPALQSVINQVKNVASVMQLQNTGSQVTQVALSAVQAMHKGSVDFKVWLQSFHKTNNTPIETIDLDVTLASRGRLSISSRMIKSANLKYGESINICWDSDAKTIAVGRDVEEGRPTGVESTGGFRFRESDFVKAFGSVPQKVKIELYDGLILVKQA